MYFNSIDFAVFLPVVFFVYWILRGSLRFQNIFLLLSSYLFYAWWDWRFLILIIASSIVDFFIGIALEKSKRKNTGRVLVSLSLAANLGILCFFKYFNFFLESLKGSFSLFGFDLPLSGLNIVLPVGISFYTFQTLSYTIDIYRGKCAATRNFVEFFAFVSFFPQLVAGPIERATNLLPQFNSPRFFDERLASDGLRQILWGLFKKVVVADNCAVLVNQIFDSPESYPGSVLALGLIFFAIQIYGDFSGYSDIAIGCAKLFGFKLMQNFSYPYFSRNISEFWQNWHISLTTWFKDYVYIPLGGSRCGNIKTARNIFLVFLLSGLWHGANTTFIVWGILHACFIIPLIWIGRRNFSNPVASGKYLPTLKESLQITGTFLLVCLSWAFFRADTLGEAVGYSTRLFTDFFDSPEVFLSFFDDCDEVLTLMGCLLIVEWFQRSRAHGLDLIFVKSRVLRFAIYYGVIFLIYRYGTVEQDFIYFQF